MTTIKFVVSFPIHGHSGSGYDHLFRREVKFDTFEEARKYKKKIDFFYNNRYKAGQRTTGERFSEFLAEMTDSCSYAIKGCAIVSQREITVTETVLLTDLNRKP
jgi:hypothetical protein